MWIDVVHSSLCTACIQTPAERLTGEVLSGCPCLEGFREACMSCKGESMGALHSRPAEVEDEPSEIDGEGAADDEGGLVGKPKEQTYEIRTPLSLSPAEGWRAIFIHEDESPPSWSEQPLIAWGVFNVVEHPAEDATGPSKDLGNHIEGVIHDGTDYGSYPDSAEELMNFWHYRRLDDPDPTKEDVNEEAARRRQ